MSASADHPIDKATFLTRSDTGLQGHSSDDYWAFIGPFGGVTTATLLRAVLDDERSAGDPLALTVNFCAPVARGSFDIDLTLSRANRSTQHWSMVLNQPDGVVATATAVFATRRPGFSHQPARRPDLPDFESLSPMVLEGGANWLQRYEFRFADGSPDFGSRREPRAEPASALSQFWLRDAPARRLDFVSLAAMSDAFFARIFHVRGMIVPFGTVSLTTYFHADAGELARQGDAPLIGVADASVFHKSFADQKAELWSRDGQLLATCHQICFFRDS